MQSPARRPRLFLYRGEKSSVGAEPSLSAGMKEGGVEVPRRYFVFCESPERLQELLDSVKYYDIKDTIVIPPVGEGDRPTVCVIMEDPDERTRLALERAKQKSKEVTAKLLKKTGALLEDLAGRLSSSKD